MGKSKTKTSTEAVYGKELKGAQGTLQGVYNQQAPKIAGYADQIGGVVPDLLQRFRDGDPALTAAKGYLTDTIQGDPASNPYLNDMLDITNNRVVNATQASMGTRGQFGGSDYAGVVAQRLAENETGARYADYDKNMARKAQAAAMVPGMMQGEYLPLGAAASAADFASTAPMRAAQGYAAGTGGLLGGYANQTTTQKKGLFDLLGMAAGGASLFV